MKTASAVLLSFFFGGRDIALTNRTLAKYYDCIVQTYRYVCMCMP